MLTKPKVMAMSARYKFLLVVAYLARADAHFGVGDGGMALTGKTTHQHQHQRLKSVPHHRDGRVLLATTLLRGGANGIEENPEYEESKNTDSISDDESNDSSSDGTDSEDESGVSSGDETEDEDSDDTTTCTLLSKTKLYHHSKSNKKNSSSVNKKFLILKSKSPAKFVLKLARKNQFKLYILLAMIAFRHDIIKMVLQYKLIRTGVFSFSSVNWTTDVLKLILVAEVIRRYFLPEARNNDSITSDENDQEDGMNKKNQTQSMEERPPTTRGKSLSLPLIISMFAIGIILPQIAGNHVWRALMILLPILPKILSPDPESPLGNLLMPILGLGGVGGDLAKRMAYVPPLEQHYAFEQLNERYYRDWGAYRKAFDTNSMVAASASSSGKVDGSSVTSGGTGGMASLLSSLMGNPGKSLPSPSATNSASMPTTKYPNEYNNGTVIVLDMTKLDSQASRMETIRDQISFLIHLVGDDEESSSPKTDKGQDSESVLVNATNITADASAANSTVSQIDNNGSLSSTTSSPTVEVIILLESPGGGVSQYGLAASHLQRLRSTPNIKLTICIDSVAASGGYMMACMSSPGQLYCAPFAMVGSIGVIGQSLNIQKTLESYGVRPYVFRGGKMKNPVGTVGDVTKEGMVAMQQMIDRIHGAFREHVASARNEAFTEALLSDAIPKPAGNYFQLGGSSEMDGPSLSIEHVMDQVATGDVFLGVQALKLGMVDRLITSDEYIAERIRQGSRVLKLIDYHKAGLFGSHNIYGLPTFKSNVGVVSLLKRVVYQMTSKLLVWAEDGLATSNSIPSVSAASVVDGFQIR